jgi:hypothetical protein
MAVSVFDLFKIGIGPSSSHTVGPMRAARMFALRLEHDGLLPRVARVVAELYGSLGATGKGHGTDKAVLLGLEGDEPDRVDIESIDARLVAIRNGGVLRLLGTQAVAFDARADLLFYRKLTLDGAPTACAFSPATRVAASWRRGCTTRSAVASSSAPRSRPTGRCSGASRPIPPCCAIRSTAARNCWRRPDAKACRSRR